MAPRPAIITGRLKDAWGTLLARGVTLGLYFKVASLRPLVLRAGIEAQVREEREENARQEVAKASADLYAALTDLQEQIQFIRLARSPAEVAAGLAERKARSQPTSVDPALGALARAAPPIADPAPSAEPASVPPRDTFTMLPPAMSSAPPSETARPDTLGDDDPTSVLSHEALERIRAGESQAPRAPD